jgi:uncharacterized Fe-S cluster-containing radical SAM superfamily protein
MVKVTNTNNKIMKKPQIKAIIHIGNDNKCETCYDMGYEFAKEEIQKEVMKILKENKYLEQEFMKEYILDYEDIKNKLNKYFEGEK